VQPFTSEQIETCFKSYLEEKGLGVGAVLPLFRLVMTGTGMGPSMFDISEFLGKEECITRMKSGIYAVETLKAQV
jgi:glutamyl-tRNA synthetase